jgi:HK97 family phage portal protein
MTIVVTPEGLQSVQKTYPFNPGRETHGGMDGGRIPLLRQEYTASSYEAMYKDQLWVWVVVNKMISGIARLPWKTYRWLDDEREQVERVRKHPLPQLLSRPWPGASGYQLKEAIVGSICVHGNALFYKARPGPGQPPNELWPLPWRDIDPVYDNSGMKYFVFNGSQNRLRIQPEDVVHYRYWGLGGPVGVSPLEPLRRTLALEDAAIEYAAGNFKNSGTPSSVFRTDQKLQDASIKRLRGELEGLYGGVENAGKFAVIDQGLDVKALQHTAVDTSLIEQRKLNREEVAAAFDITPVVIGILDRATFANVDELHLALYVDTFGPRLTLIEETTQVQLIEPEVMFDGVFTEYDLNEILKGNIETRSAAYQRFQQASVYTPNEMRRRENLPPIGDPNDPKNPANQILIPLNMIPSGASREDVEARARAAAIFPPTPAPEPNGHHPEKVPADIQ